MAVSNDFTASELDLNGMASIGGPTALVWGPDGRLYVTEVSGDVNILSVAFGDKDPGDGENTAQFYVTEGQSLSGVRGIQNHNDDGAENSSQNRQITGIDVTRQFDANGDQVFYDGKPAVVIYVTSSDSRIGAGGSGNDANLDTNSGVITRMTEQPDGSFVTVDLIRGLARSEENHATNGLEIIQEIDPETGKLLSERMIVANGGNANTGAPSNNFAGQQEQPYSAAILEVDLDQINTMPVLDDDGRAYIHDLPTLNDPTRAGDDDNNDPFGGNDGLNSAKTTFDSPVQIYSAGYRNAFDVEVTEDGRVWTYDNGANNNWGGRPAGEDLDGDADAQELSEAGGTPDGYIATNLFVEDNNEIAGNFNPQNWDSLHEITRSDDLGARQLSAGLGGAETYTWEHPDFGTLELVYGGHPNPTRAEGARAGILYSPEGGVNGAKLMVSNNAKDDGEGGTTSDFLEVIDWLTSIGYEDDFLNEYVVAVDPGVRYADSFAAGYGPTSGRPSAVGEYSLVEDANGPVGLPDDIDTIVHALNPIEGDYREAGYTDGSVDTNKGSVNGLAEYTSTILDDAANGIKMSGALWATTFNGTYLLIGRDEDGIVQTGTASGRTVAADKTTIQAGGGPLGLSAIGDDLTAFGGQQAFRGTVWSTIYKENGPVIEIFQPGNPDTNPLLPVYAGQEPSDPTDRDLDGIDHINDPFDYSASNGYALAVGEKLVLDFVLNPPNPDFSGSLGDTGLFGAALDGITPNRDALTEDDGFTDPSVLEDGLFDVGGNVILGGNAPLFNNKVVKDGTAVGTTAQGGNSLRDAVQTGVNIDSDVKRLVAAIDIANWTADQAPDEAGEGGRKTGLMFGDGTQSNFVRFFFGDIGDGVLGLEVGIEINDVYTILGTLTDPAFTTALTDFDTSQEQTLLGQKAVTLELEIADIGGDYDIVARYAIAGETEFQTVALNAGNGTTLPADSTLRAVLDGTHQISDIDTTANSGAAIGLFAEKDDGTAFTAVDFNEIRIEAFGNEIAANDAAGVGAGGTAGTDTIIYDGTDIDLGALANDVENFDGSASSAAFNVAGNALSNTIKVGAGQNTIATGAGSDKVVGTKATLNSDEITDFTIEDKVVITDATLADTAGITYAAGSAIVRLNGVEIEFSGPDFADFAPADGPGTFNFVDGEDGLEITLAPDETVIYRVNAGGTVAAIDGGIEWLGDNNLGATPTGGITMTGNKASTFSNTLTDAENEVDFDNVDDAIAPWDLFVDERGQGGTEYTFAVTAGNTYKIEYFYTENWNNIFQGGPREFDVSVEGAVPAAFENLNPFAEAQDFVGTPAPASNGASNAEKQPYLGVARKAEFVYTATDDTLNLELINNIQEAKVNAIQITQLSGTFVPPSDTTAPVIEEIFMENPQNVTDGERTVFVTVTDETGFAANAFDTVPGSVLQFSGYTPASIAAPTANISADGKTAVLEFDVLAQNDAWINGTTGTISIAAGAFGDAAGNTTAAASTGFLVQSNLAALDRGGVVRAINIGTDSNDVGTLAPDQEEGGATDNNAYGGAIAADSLINDAFGNPVAFEADSDSYHTSPKANQFANVDGKSGGTGSNSGGVDLDGSAYHTYRDSGAGSWTSTFDGFANGAYIVELHFAELFADTAAQSRVGDFTVNGVVFGDDYDAFVVAGGADKPSFLRMPVTVTDGTIQVLVNDITTGQAGYSAIVVYDAVDPSAPATLSIGDVTVAEGEDATITVTRTGDLSETTTVDVALNFDGSADSADVGDLSAGSVSFEEGQSVATLTLPITDDTELEGAETLSVTLSNASGDAVIADASGTVTIGASDSDLQAPVGATIFELDFEGVGGEVLATSGFDGALGTVAANVDEATSEIENGQLVVNTAEGDINDGAPGSINDFTKSVDLSDPALNEVFLTTRFDNPFDAAFFAAQELTGTNVPNYAQQGIVIGTGTQLAGEMVKLVWGGVAAGAGAADATGVQIWTKGSGFAGQQIVIGDMIEVGKTLLDVASIEMSLVIDKDSGTVGQYVTLFDDTGATIGGVRPVATAGFATGAPIVLAPAVLANILSTTEATHVGVTSSDNGPDVSTVTSFEASWDFLRLSSPQFVDGPAPDSVNGVATADGDFSDDNLAPTNIGTLAEGTTEIVATQAGNDAPGGRERDYITFIVEEGQELTGIIVKGYEGGETDSVSQGFMGLAEGATVPLDQATFEGNFPDGTGLLGGYIYSESDAPGAAFAEGNNVLDELGDGEEQGYTFVGFDGALPAGTYTLWLNQGASNPSTVTLDLVTAPVVAAPVELSIVDADPVLESGDEGTSSTLAFTLTADDPAFSGDVTVTYDAGGDTGLTQSVTFAGGTGTLSVDVANDDIDTGDTDVTVTLTAASAATGTFVISATDGDAAGIVTEDDIVEPTFEKGAFVFGVNVGGGAVVDTDGNEFAAFDATEWNAGAQTYAPTSANEADHDGDGDVDNDDEIYDSELYDDPLTFTRSGIPAGDYILTLKLAEIFDGASAGNRLIDFTVNGVQVTQALDIFSEAGGFNTALDLDFNVTIADEGDGTGTLTIVGDVPADNAKINGLALFESVEVDPTAVAVSVADVTVSEEDGTALVEFTREGNTENDMVVTYSTADGTALSGADYTAAASQTVTILAGDTTATASITLTNDTAVENDETFTVTIEGATSDGANVTIPTPSATVTVTDSDEPIFVKGDFVFGVNAGAGSAVTDTDGNLFEATDNAEWSFQSQSGSPAGNTVDYTGDGVDNADDTVYETENWGGSASSSPLTFTRTGIDAGDYILVVKLAEIFANADEPGERVFDVVVNGELAIDDLDLVAEVGQNVAYDVEIPVTIANEGDGTGTLVVQGLPSVDNAKFSALALFEKVVFDPTAVDVSVGDVTVSEEAGTADVVFTREGNTENDMVITYSTADGSATADADYTAATAATVTILAGQTTATAQITLLGDMLEEGPEAFTVTIDSAVSTGATVTVADAEATVTLTDDDAVDPADIDGDGILNSDDPFAYDGTNGDARVLVAGGEFTQDFNTDTTDPFDADGGFSGILVNPAFDYPNASESDPYGDRTNEADVSISNGTLSVLSTETDTFSNGTGANNTLADGYQSAVDVTGLDTFEVHARASSADWYSKVTSTTGFEQFGISLGAGGVDDFVKLVVGDGGSGGPRVQISHNNSLEGSNDNNYPFGAAGGPSVDLALVGDIEFRLIVDRAAGANGQITGQVDFFAADGSGLLESYTTPAANILGDSSLIAAMNGQNPLTGGDGGLAYGIFVTDWSGGGAANRFTADYDFLTIRALDNDPATVTLENVVTDLDENTDTTAAIKVADIVVTDDGAGTNVLALDGADAESFEILGTELFLKAGTTLDFETLSSLDVTVTVDDAAIAGTPDNSATLNLAVNDVNEAPSMVVTPVITTVAENDDRSAPIVLATVVITDDALGTNDLTLAGPDAELFEIFDNAGVTEVRLKEGSALDFETQTSFDVSVELDDAAIGTTPEQVQALTLNVTDFVEPRTVALAPIVTSVFENTDTTAGSVKVADIVVGGQEVGITTLDVIGNDAALFTIVDGATGPELHLAQNAVLDFEANPVLDIAVTLDDDGVNGAGVDVQTDLLSLPVTDTNQAPSLSVSTVLNDLSEAMDVSVATKVADITVTDDAIGENTLTLEGTDAALFEIVGLELFLKAGVVLDFETNAVLDVSVVLDDVAVGATPDATAPLSFNVLDAEERTETSATPGDLPGAGGTGGGTDEEDIVEYTGSDPVGDAAAPYVLPDNYESFTASGTGTVNVRGNTGDNTITLGAGVDDTVDLSDGGADVVTGTGADLDGTTITGLSSDDEIRVTDGVNPAIVSVTNGSTVIGIDLDEDGVADTTVTLTETVSASRVNGAVNGNGELVITVADDLAPTVLVEIPAQTATEDAPFSFAVPAGTFDDDAGVAGLTLTATLDDDTALPTWLTFDGTTFTANPTQAEVDAGAIRVKVTATDANGGAVSSTFALGTDNVNDAPVAVDDEVEALPNTTLVIEAATLLVNDTDEDGDTLTITSVGNAVGGTVSLSDTTISFTATPGAPVSSFEYTATDGTEVTTATVTVLGGEAVSSTPVAIEAAQLSSYDTQDVQPAAFAIAPDGSSIEITGNSWKKLQLDAPLTIVEGTVLRFSFSSTDLGEIHAIGLENNNSHGKIANAPGQLFFGLAGSQLNWNVLNQVQPEPYAIGGAQNDAGGNRTFEIDLSQWAGQSYDKLVFVNDADQNAGNGTFSNIEIRKPIVLNTAPVAGDDAFTISNLAPVNLAPVTLLANDSDLDGDSLTVVSVGVASSGSVSFEGGLVTYTPEPGFVGEATFQYTITDGKGGQDTAVVTLDVGSVVDVVNTVTIPNPPALSAYATGQDKAPASATTVAADGNSVQFTGNSWKKLALDNGGYEITENTVLRFTFSSTELGEIHAIGLETNNSLGTIRAGVAPAGQLFFGIAGSEAATWNSLTALVDDPYETGDGAKTYNIDLSAYAGQTFTSMVFTNDIDAAGASANGTFSSVAFVEKSTAPGVNVDPTAVDDGPYNVQLDTVQSIATGLLLANDTDDDGDSLTFVDVVANSATGGTASYNAATNRVDFTPDTGFLGAASFEYRVSDGKGGVDTAKVTLNVVDPASVEVSTPIDFSFQTISSYDDQDTRPGAGTTVTEGGNSIQLNGNVWKSVALASYEFTENTVLAFSFRLDAPGEIHGIGFDTDNTFKTNGKTLFQLAGSQTLGQLNQDYASDYRPGELVEYRIDLSEFAGRPFNKLVLINDHDGAPQNASEFFTNVRLIEVLDGVDTGESPYILTGNGEIADIVVDEDGLLETNLPIIDPDTPQGDLNVTYSGLPDFVTANGVGLSGTPDNDDVGSYVITVTATDPEFNSVTDTFTLTVNNTNDAPTAAAAALPGIAGVAGAPLAIDLPLGFFEDVDVGDTLTYSLVGAPTGVTIDPTTGEITGAPTEVGSFNMSVIATDGSLETASASIALTVSDGAPRESILIEAENFTGLGSAINFVTEVAATASNNQLIRLGSGQTGEVSTDLAAAGALEGFYDLAIQYYDENDGQAELTVLIDNGEGAGPQQVAFEVFDATGLPGQGSSTQAGNIQTLVISGVAVSNTATLILRGKADNDLVRLDKVELTPVSNIPPVLDATAAVALDENVIDVATIAAVDPEGAAVSYMISGGADADLFAIDAASGALTFVAAPDFEAPADAGADNTYEVQVSASDGIAISRQDLTVTIAGVNEAPVETNPGTQSTRVGEPATLPTLASLFADPDLNDTVTYAVDTLPAGVTLNADGITLEGTPTTLGTTTVTVTATDAAGLTATSTFDIAVVDFDPADYAPGGDLDGDGNLNAVDADIDGDGVNNADDPFAYDINDGMTVGAGQTRTYDFGLDGTIFENGMTGFLQGTTNGGVFNEDTGAATVSGGTMNVDPVTSGDTGGVNNPQDDAVVGVKNATFTAQTVIVNPWAGAAVNPNSFDQLGLVLGVDSADMIKMVFGQSSGVVEFQKQEADAGTKFGGASANANIALPAGVTLDNFETAEITFEVISTDASAATINGTIRFLDGAGGEVGSLGPIAAPIGGALATALADPATGVAVGFTHVNGGGDPSFVAQMDSLTITAPGDGSSGGGDDTVVYRINAGGDLVQAIDGGPNWAADAVGATNPFLTTTDDRADAPTAGYVGDAASIPAGLPEATLDTARSSDEPFTYSIPTTVLGGNGNYEVRLYLAELFAGGQAGDFRVFDATLEGFVPTAFDNIDPGLSFGADSGVLTAQVAVLDGTLDIGFLGAPLSGTGGKQNPIINAIEVVKLAGDIDGPPPPVDATDAIAILNAAQGVDSNGSYGAGAVGSAKLTIKENSNDVQTSNFGTDSFKLTNTGDKQIAAVFVDFRDALYRDSVVDFDGTAGDTAAKEFKPEGGKDNTGAIENGADSATYFLPGEDPLPNDTGTGNASTGGWRGVMIRFDGSDGGFENGEFIGFSGDMDPNSVAGLEKNGGNGIDPGSISGDRSQWDVGGVSGAELIGSSFTVLFDDGSTATGYLGTDGSVAGSVGTAVQGRDVKTASVIVNGADSTNVASYGGTEPVITVTGTPGDTVIVTMTKGLNPVLNNSNGIADLVAARLADAHPEFEANNAADFQSVTLTIGAGGTATVPAGTFDYNNASANGQDYGNGSAYTNGFDTAPIAVAVAVVDGDDNPLGPVDRVYAKSNGTPVEGGGATGAEGYFAANDSGTNNAYFKIQIEDENGTGGSNPGGKWDYQTSADSAGRQTGFQGDGYYVFGSETSTAIDNANGGNEMLEYTVFIGADDLGTWDFEFRVSRDGQEAGDQQNDLWLNFKHAEEPGVGDIEEFFSAMGSNEPEQAVGGFVKVFGGPNNGTWGDSGTVDGGPGDFPARITIDEPGLYTVQIDGRSQGYHVDYFELYKGSDPGNGAANSAFIEGEPGDTGGGGGNTGDGIVVAIDSAGDDVEENTNGTIGNKADLELGDNGRDLGLRFTGIDLESLQGVDIAEAYIEFTARTNGGSNGTVNANVHLEDSLNPAAYSNGNLPSDRDSFDFVPWTDSDVPGGGETFRTADLSGMIEDFVAANANDLGSNDDLAFFIDGLSGVRKAQAFEAPGDDQPELHIIFADEVG